MMLLLLIHFVFIFIDLRWFLVIPIESYSFFYWMSLNSIGFHWFYCFYWLSLISLVTIDSHRLSLILLMSQRFPSISIDFHCFCEFLVNYIECHWFVMICIDVIDVIDVHWFYWFYWFWAGSNSPSSVNSRRDMQGGMQGGHSTNSHWCLLILIEFY